MDRSDQPAAEPTPTAPARFEHLVAPTVEARVAAVARAVAGRDGPVFLVGNPLRAALTLRRILFQISSDEMAEIDDEAQSLRTILTAPSCLLVVAQPETLDPDVVPFLRDCRGLTVLFVAGPDFVAPAGSQPYEPITEGAADKVPEPRPEPTNAAALPEPVVPTGPLVPRPTLDRPSTGAPAGRRIAVLATVVLALCAVIGVAAARRHPGSAPVTVGALPSVALPAAPGPLAPAPPAPTEEAHALPLTGQAEPPPTSPPTPTAMPGPAELGQSAAPLPREGHAAAPDHALRVVIHYRDSSAAGAAAASRLAGQLAGETGSVQARAVVWTPSQPSIRYFHPEDAAGARHLAELMPGGVAAWPRRNFSGFRPPPSAGTVEVWLPDR